MSLKLEGFIGELIGRERTKPRILMRLVGVLAMILLAPFFLLAGLMLFTIVLTVPATYLFCTLGLYWNAFFHMAFGGTEAIYQIRCNQCGKEFRNRKPHYVRHFNCLCPGCYTTLQIKK